MQKQTKTYRMSLRLDEVEDLDIIAWLEGLPQGRRSRALREALRAGIQTDPPSGSRFDPDLLRRIIGEELERLLSSYQLTRQPEDIPVNELEEAFGEQLDQLLSRF